MPRREFFFAPKQQFTTGFITLEDDEHRHLTGVLHHKTGDLVTLVDGEGTAAVDCEIIEISRRFTRLRINTLSKNLGEPGVHLTLAQAVPKGSRFDWLIEKSTEIGISAIIPLHCKRSGFIPGSGKIERWKRLAKAAMKQCCRSVCPEINEVMSFTDLCSAVKDYNLGIIADEGNGKFKTGLQSTPLPKKILVMIGPEGGFTPEELQLAQKNGCQPIGLGSRRLRAETAGLVAVTIILSQLGQLD